MPDWVTLPGTIEYNKALDLMHSKLEGVIEERSDETVFLLEHDDVYTAGTSFKPEELLDMGDIPLIYTGRGGKFTYHGPGQRIIYPVLDLRKKNRQQDLRLYIKNLEQWIINTLAHFGLKAYIIDGMIGIWVDTNQGPAKIGAIGVRVRKWVTYHGIAVNITTNLDKFSGIIPCGIRDFNITSLKELKIKANMSEFDAVLKQEFDKLFECKLTN